MSWDWLLVVFGLLAVGMWCWDQIDSFQPTADELHQWGDCWPDTCPFCVRAGGAS